ncbi:MAG: hypothetical protein M3004_14520 [Bacteroidota bacterium]|nr:hypothetical protein [Bacteroidota bacterium]
MKSNFFKSGVYAGLIGGLVFMMMEMIMVPLFMNGSPWGPPRLIAAIGMGKSVLPPPATFDLMMFMMAMIIHFILSIIYALSFGAIVSKLGLSVSLIAGMALGLVLYFVNFYGFTAIFPWFAMARNWVTVVTHLVFGLIAVRVFKHYYLRPVTQ